MKSVSKVMYTIGKVINILELVFACCGIVFGSLCIAFKNDIAQRALETSVERFNSPVEVRRFGIALIVAAAISFAIALVVYILAKKATKALKENKNGTTAHTIMLVIGVFGDLFYFLGGLFGLLCANEKPEAPEKE